MIPTPTDTTLASLARLIAGQKDPVARAEARILAARSLRQLGCFGHARAALEAALEDAPDNANVQRSLGLERFRAGDVAGGLSLYDAGRWRLDSHARFRRPFTAPYWAGESLRGKRALIWAEQGIGDQIMQARILPRLLEMGAQVTLEADPRLFALLGDLRPRLRCAPQLVPAHPKLVAERFDFQSSMFSAWRFVPDPMQGADWMTADAPRSAAYRAAWARMGRARNIGLSWASRNATSGAARTLDLALLQPLGDLPGLRFHSLQYGAVDLKAESARLGAPIIADGNVDPLQALDGQAAQIAALDLVITIDNATAHLAGSLGVPTWLLLPKGSEWRWGTHPTQTRLYPGMRLFRASDHGQWGGALWKLFQALKAWRVPPR